MTRIGSFVTIAALVLVAPLAGQGSQSADARAQVVIQPAFSLHNFTGLDFGTHFASDGKVANQSIATWSLHIEPIAEPVDVSFAFTPEPKLTRDGGVDFVTILYGATSGLLSGGAGGFQQFNPATGFTTTLNVATQGDFEVNLGSHQAGVDDFVTVDLTGKAAGTYTGIITLTVTVL